MNVFDGRDIRVVARLFDGSPTLVITFTGRAAKPPVEKGFGEPYLIKRRVSAIHFISKANHWWQTSEPLAAIAQLREAGLLNGYERTCLYGSSMGGYAALIYSRLLTPDQIVAFSPQFSIDAARVPFEKRWRNYAAQVSFDHDDMASGLAPDVPARVVFDPFYAPDAAHVDLVERLRPIDRVPIAFAGHNTARMLQELGIITEITDSLLLGGFDPARFTRRCRAERERSSLFWFGLAGALRDHGRAAQASLPAMIAGLLVTRADRMRDPTLRLDILHQALESAADVDDAGLAAEWIAAIVAQDPDSHRTAHARAVEALLRDDFESAARWSTTAVAGNPASVAYARTRLLVLLRTEGPAAARAFHNRLKPQRQRDVAVQLASARIALSEGERGSAIEQLQRVCRSQRRHPEARLLLARAWLAEGRAKAVPVQLAAIAGHPIGHPEHAREARRLLEAAGALGAATALGEREARFRQRYKAIRRQALRANWFDVAQTIAAIRSANRAVSVS